MAVKCWRIAHFCINADEIQNLERNQLLLKIIWKKILCCENMFQDKCTKCGPLIAETYFRLAEVNVTFQLAQNCHPSF